MTATLLASLFTVIAASTALASVTATSAGTFAPGTTSPGTVTFTFVERAATTPDGLPAGPGSLAVTINDQDGGNVTFSGTASTVGSTGSLGVTATPAGSVLNIAWTASDTLNVETIVVSGLKIAADAAALPGPVIATLSGPNVSAFFAPSATSTTTATGVIQASNTLIAGSDSAAILLSSVCPFAVTAVNPVNSLASFSDAADARAVIVPPGVPAGGVQTVTFAAGTAAHPAGTTVTQTVSQLDCGALTIPTAVGVIANALAYTSLDGNPNVFPGESNQGAGRLQLVEPIAGFLPDATTVTLTIQTAGVVFTSPATVTRPVGDAVLASPFVTLSADRTVATFKVTTASTVASTFIIGTTPITNVNNIRYDVASTVASGTLVTVGVSLSSGGLVNPATRTNAQVGRIFNASASATIPNVNIGQNGQVAGLITIVEVVAGSFTDGTGANNVFEICPDVTASFTSPGPSAFVTGGVAAGNIILREGAAASTDNAVPGTADPTRPGCYYWTVWTKSTTASTITIGSTATVGPLVNVNAGFPAGTLNANLFSGSLATLTLQVSLTIANRVFPGQVKVTALSQPTMALGATHAPAGNILIEETGNGQLKLGSDICIEIVPNQNTGLLTDAYMTDLFTSDLPIATASGGVVVNAVRVTQGQNCNGFALSGPVGSLTGSIRFLIAQQSTTGTGKVTISNLHYSVLNDAVNGPVQVNVWAFGVGNTNVDFQRIISNAKIGSTVAGTNATRLGVTQTGRFTTSTKLPHRNGYVTYRIDFGIGAAHQLVAIWGATKHGNDWTAFTRITSRVANASGVVYYYIRQSSLTWKSYRGNWIGGGVWTPARQTHWIR